MKKLFVWLVVIAALVIGGIYLSKSGGEEKTENTVEKYFASKMIELAINDIGIAIEGFDSNLLMMAFPGLKASDFQGVETPEGIYEVSGDAVNFVRNASAPITSAERMISEKGYGTLLKNISSRIGMPAETEAHADKIIEKINTAERVKVKLNESGSALGFKITPTELMEDSRCAIDVTCIQAGTVRVRASIETPTGNGSKIFDLEKPVIVGNWEVALVQVDPVPESTKEISGGDYLFFFRISTRIN